MWGIENTFHRINSKKNPNAAVEVFFEKIKFQGWVTCAVHKRKNPAYRLWFSEDLQFKLKDTYLMSYMRDIESRLRKEKGLEIENEIPFWEFLDIEYDNAKNVFYFTAYYTQKPNFPELFKRLIGSPSLHKIDREISEKDSIRVFKNDWKEREYFETEVGAKNVVYMLIDTEAKLFYIGEAKDLIKRFNQGHTAIPNWNYYRYDVLPSLMENLRLEIEKMFIRDFATIFSNIENIPTLQLSDYKLVNRKIDKY